MPDNPLSNFVKYSRNKLNLTQQQLAEKAGVGLRFIRDLEQGKESLRLDKVNQVLSLFGFQMSPGSEKILDPWDINLRYLNRPVILYLKNKETRYGMIIDQILENGEVKAWKFIPNRFAVQYRKTQDPKFVEQILHADISNIETQENQDSQ